VWLQFFIQATAGLTLSYFGVVLHFIVLVLLLRLLVLMLHFVGLLLLWCALYIMTLLFLPVLLPMNAAYCGVPVLLMFYSCATNLYVYDDVVIQFIFMLLLYLMLLQLLWCVSYHDVVVTHAVAFVCCIL
jgi:hypothetical protein